MEAMTATDLHAIERGWKAFAETAGIRALRTEAEYDRALALVQAILNTTRNKPEREDVTHPLNALLAFLTPAIEAYEAEHHPVPTFSAREYLRTLMQEHGLTQSQLPEIGNQSVVSQVLSGKRRLNARQIAGLAKRFKVPAEAFLEQEAYQEMT
jgi:HTH-type transcriptional regulator/antitoxin HigA